MKDLPPEPRTRRILYLCIFEAIELIFQISAYRLGIFDAKYEFIGHGWRSDRSID